MPGSLLQNVDWTQNSEIMVPPQVCLPLRPARHIPRVLEIAEGLPVSAVQGPVGDAQQLRRARQEDARPVGCAAAAGLCLERRRQRLYRCAEGDGGELAASVGSSGGVEPVEVG